MPALFFDLDGTLVYQGTNKPIGDSVEMVNRFYDAGDDVIIVTRRGDREFEGHKIYGREQTLAALNSIGFKYHHIIFDVSSPRLMINDSGAACLNCKRDEGVGEEDIHSSSEEWGGMFIL